MITLTLPYPPSTNHLYATVNGRNVLSKAGREYHTAIEHTVAMQMPGFIGFGDQRIAYTVTVFPPDRRRRDLSNLIKAVEDGLTKSGIWGDDSQVDDLHWMRGTPAKGGSLFVEIREAA